MDTLLNIIEITVGIGLTVIILGLAVGLIGELISIFFDKDDGP